MANDSSCICCNGTEAVPHLDGLLRCPSCGHVWADLCLTDEQLRDLYSRSYFHGAEYVDYEQEGPALRRNFQPRVRMLLERHPRGGRLWEVGAAYGFFLKEAAPHFNVAGCDISEHAADYARNVNGVDVVAGDYLRIEAGTPFDVVCMWDTIEHLREPHEYVAKAARDLRPGGTLALSTGDIGALAARLRGRKWRLLHPPTHLHYFTANSIRILLERSGFEDIHIAHPPFWRSFDSVASRFLGGTCREPGTGLYRILKASGILKCFFPLNTFDLMVVHATRTPARGASVAGRRHA